MSTFTNPLTFPFLYLYPTKYSFNDMKKVYRDKYGKNLIWSYIPEDFVEQIAIPREILQSQHSNLTHSILLERNKWRILQLYEGQPQKIEYDIFNTWNVLQDTMVEGFILVSEIYSPSFVLVSFLSTNYCLLSGDILNLSVITINIDTNESSINTMDLGDPKITLDELIKQPMCNIKTKGELSNEEIEKLKNNLLEHLKNNKYGGLVPILNSYPPKYKEYKYNDTDSASIPIIKKKDNIMINIEGKLRIMIERNIRYGHKILPIHIGMENKHGGIHLLKEMIFDEIEDPSATTAEMIFIQEDVCQDLIDDLYRAGFRPSDEIKKNDLIQTLQKEIAKRDEWKSEWEEADNYMIKILKQEIDKKDKIIESLMNQFVFKSDPNACRKISL